MSVCPIMLPAAIALLESDPLPAHVPVMDAGTVEPDGAVEELAPHAAANNVIRTTANVFCILPTCCCGTRAGATTVEITTAARTSHLVTLYTAPAVPAKPK